MEESNTQKKRKPWIFAFMFVMTGAILFVGNYLYGMETAVFLRNMVMGLLGCGLAVFSFRMSEENNLFIYENGGRYWRFTLLFLISIAASSLLPLLPVAGWPFLAIFVMLGLFTNVMTGIVAGSICLLIATNFAMTDYNVFLLYFISGVVGIYVFSTIDEEFKVGLPVFISLIVLGLCLTANVVLFINEKLAIAQFAIPIVNVLVSFILLLIILKWFCTVVILKYRDKYMEINDPECPLLVKLKELSKDEYYHAIHTAYLSDRIAKRLGLNDNAVKTCGYYHRIGKIYGKNTWENVEMICEEYEFPPYAKRILKEYVDKQEKMLTKETIVVLFADCIVSSILFLFRKNPNAEINYEQLVDTVFRKKMESEELWDSSISLAQISEMRRIFIEEKLYYDFLR